MADPAAVVRTRGDGAALASVRQLLAPHRAEPVDGLPPFQGGAAGYITYDWGLTLERLPAPRYDDLALPDVVLGIYDWVLAWDHVASRAWLISTGIPETSRAARASRAADRARAIRERLQVGPVLLDRPERVRNHVGPVLSDQPDRVHPFARSYPVEGGWWDSAFELRSSFTRSGYLDAVRRVRDYIFAGDIFQANLSQRFEAPLHESP